jgi:hypothetical protein
VKSFKAFSIFLIIVSLFSGCIIQLGGTKNSAEQGRSVPAPSQDADQQAARAQQASESQRKAEEEKKAEEARLAEAQRVEAERQANEDRLAAQRQSLEEQQAELERLESERHEAEVSAREQERYELEQRRIAEEQRLAIATAKREAEERRLAELQRRNEVPLRSVVPAVPAQGPSRPQVYAINPNFPIPQEEKKKGHSTRKKVLIAGAIGGGTVLGIILARRH